MPEFTASSDVIEASASLNQKHAVLELHRTEIGQGRLNLLYEDYLKNSILAVLLVHRYAIVPSLLDSTPHQRQKSPNNHKTHVYTRAHISMELPLPNSGPISAAWVSHLDLPPLAPTPPTLQTRASHFHRPPGSAPPPSLPSPPC